MSERLLPQKDGDKARSVTQKTGATPEKKTGPDTSFYEASKVNGTEVSVGWDRIYGDYTIYFPQIEVNEEAHEHGVHDQVIRLTRRPEVAKQVYDKAVELAEQTTDVYELYKQIKTFSRELPYDEE